jgi:hypothetical protein
MLEFQEQRESELERELYFNSVLDGTFCKYTRDVMKSTSISNNRTYLTTFSLTRVPFFLFFLLIFTFKRCCAKSILILIAQKEEKQKFQYCGCLVTC